MAFEYSVLEQHSEQPPDFSDRTDCMWCGDPLPSNPVRGEHWDFDDEVCYCDRTCASEGMRRRWILANLRARQAEPRPPIPRAIRAEKRDGETWLMCACGSSVTWTALVALDDDVAEQFHRQHIDCRGLDSAEPWITAPVLVLNSLVRFKKRVKAYRALLPTMEYREYLKTLHWKEQADSCKARAGGRCQVCNAAGPLHAHHRTYERRGAERPDDLIALCQPCHDLFHMHRRVVRL